MDTGGSFEKKKATSLEKNLILCCQKSPSSAANQKIMQIDKIEEKLQKSSISFFFKKTFVVSILYFKFFFFSLQRGVGRGHVHIWDSCAEN